MLDHSYAALMRERNAKRRIIRRHGTLTRYDRGCRCAVCTAKNAFACREYAATKRMLAATKRMLAGLRAMREAASDRTGIKTQPRRTRKRRTQA